MPQFDPSSFPSQIFWLVVTFLLLFLFVRYVASPRMAATLEARRDRIEGDLDRAGALQKEAEEIEAEYEATLAETRAKAREIVRETSEAAKAQAAQAHQALGEKLTADIKAAEARIGEARKEAAARIEDVASEVARAATERLLGAKVSEAEARAAVGNVGGTG